MRDWQTDILTSPRLGSLPDTLRGRATSVPVGLPAAMTESTQSQSIDVWDTYTVAAGEAIDFTSNLAFSLNTPECFLTIAGSVALTWDSDSRSAIGIGHDLVFGGGGGLVLIKDSGVFQVTASGLAPAYGYAAGGQDSIVNHGLFEVSADSDAGGIGDYSGGIHFYANTVTGVELIVLGAGFSYNIELSDGTVAGGKHLTVDGAALGSG